MEFNTYHIHTKIMTEQNNQESIDQNRLIAERREKLNEWRNNKPAFPNQSRRTDLMQNLQHKFQNISEFDENSKNQTFNIAGRIMLKRIMGKAAFATLQDMSGKLQIYVSKNDVGDNDYNDFKKYDLGDIIGVSGYLMRTKTGELTLHATKILLLSKSLRPLPDKFHGLTDTEMKYRQRYVDLIVNPQTRDTFVKRSKILQFIRNFMMDSNFMEVETPMMHPIAGGANAKPFITFHNALEQQMYLRIAPELYLKRLVVGGFEKVFEINRNFRNEGLSPRHNPEFTMMEFYEAYADYKMMMDFTENLIRQTAEQVLGTTKITYQGKDLDLSRTFARLTMVEAIQKFHPEFKDNADELQNAEFLKNKIKFFGEEVINAETAGIGALQLQLFEACAEKNLWEPTFIVDYPVEVSPLARASDSNKEITERFELFVVGRELANGFSELNDPEDQAERFKAQVAAKDAGDEEAMFYDADYIRALEYGLPPTGGCGIGIDRLVMLLTDAPAIRDVILFPQMRMEAISE